MVSKCILIPTRISTAFYQPNCHFTQQTISQRMLRNTYFTTHFNHWESKALLRYFATRKHSEYWVFMLTSDSTHISSAYHRIHLTILTTVVKQYDMNVWNLTSVGFCLVYSINLVFITALGNGKTLKGRFMRWYQLRVMLRQPSSS